MLTRLFSTHECDVNYKDNYVDLNPLCVYIVKANYQIELVSMAG